MGFQTAKDSMAFNGSKQSFDRASEKDIKLYQKRVLDLKAEIKELTGKRAILSDEISKKTSTKVSDIEKIKSESQNIREKLLKESKSLEQDRISFEQYCASKLSKIKEDENRSKKIIASSTELLDKAMALQSKNKESEKRVNDHGQRILEKEVAVEGFEKRLSEHKEYLDFETSKLEKRTLELNKLASDLATKEALVNKDLKTQETISWLLDSDVDTIIDEISKKLQSQADQINKAKSKELNASESVLRIKQNLDTKEHSHSQRVNDLNEQEQSLNARMNKLSALKTNINKLKTIKIGGK